MSGFCIVVVDLDFIHVESLVRNLAVPPTSGASRHPLDGPGAAGRFPAPPERRQQPARQHYGVVHCVFAAGPYEALEEAGAARMVTTNSISHPCNEFDLNRVLVE